MSNKRQLLDPLCTFCKIVTILFNEINTKISIHNHVLSLQKPNNYQFIIRMINGDGRENISELFYAIIRVIKWYMYDDKTYMGPNCKSIYNTEYIKRIVLYGRDALIKLQDTYEHGNVTLAIQFYINILDDALKGTFNDSKLPKNILKYDEYDNNLLDYNKLKEFWDIKRLKAICDLFDQCKKLDDNKDDNEYQDNILLNGYMQSINSILEVTDMEFNKLIINSTKG